MSNGDWLTSRTLLNLIHLLMIQSKRSHGFVAPCDGAERRLVARVGARGYIDYSG